MKAALISGFQPFMNVDSFFTQGYGHDICQDYATHGENEHFVYCIVSDGCSDSPKSDVGARILAETLAAALKLNLPLDSPYFFGRTFREYISDSLPIIQKLLRLPDSTFDATLLALIFCKDVDCLFALIWGDGVLHLKYEDFNHTRIFEHTNGAPYYLSYSLAKDGKEKYEQTFGSNLLKVSDINTNGEFMWNSEEEPYYSQQIPIKGLISVSVMSDGVHTYSDSANERIPLDEVLERVVGYKGYQGSFVTRRMKRIEKEDKQEGNSHFDDISVATMSFT